MTANAFSVPSPGTLPFTLDASDPAFYAQDNYSEAFNWIHANAPVYFCDAVYSEPFWNVCDDFRNNNHDPNGGPAHVDPNGNMVVPPNTVLPPLVPFQTGN
jgi:hypothetical protein